MAKKFGASLTERQISLARAFERAGITTYSQAIKVLERRDDEQVATWKKQLQEKETN